MLHATDILILLTKRKTKFKTENVFQEKGTDIRHDIRVSSFGGGTYYVNKGTSLVGWICQALLGDVLE